MKKCYFVQFLITKSGKDFHSSVFVEFDLLTLKISIEELIVDSIFLKNHRDLLIGGVKKEI